MTKHSYSQLLARLAAIAKSPNVEMRRLGRFESGQNSYEIMAVELGQCEHGKHEVMIAAGIHGDEPAGVEAAVRFLEHNAGNESLLEEASFLVFPCNNPSGYELGTRENADGIDLNRQFATSKPPPEVQIIMNALNGRCFDLVFEMHEDSDSPGLYLYEIAEDTSLFIGESILQAAVEQGCPINVNPIIEGMAAESGLILRKRVRFRKTHLPQAIYTYRTCGGHVITMEPPISVLSFEARVRVELTALDIALRSLLGQSE